MFVGPLALTADRENIMSSSTAILPSATPGRSNESTAQPRSPRHPQRAATSRLAVALRWRREGAHPPTHLILEGGELAKGLPTYECHNRNPLIVPSDDHYLKETAKSCFVTWPFPSCVRFPLSQESGERVGSWRGS